MSRNRITNTLSLPVEPTADVSLAVVPTTDAVTDVLTDVIRRGARDLLTKAVEAEVACWIEGHAHHTNADGHRQVVRNGHMPTRSILTGIGLIEVTQPRVHDRRSEAERERFRSKILPLYLRKTRSIEELIPWLYLKGVSTGDFTEALQALVGPNAPGLSASTVTRLKGVWEQDFKVWNLRSLKGKRYVYLWADGVHFNIRLEEDRQCLLVLMGATADGKKELIAITDGHAESEQCWKELLLDVKSRGLTIDPKLATADGALGFWKAIRQVFTTTREQRCWVHKTQNVLCKLPKRLHGVAKDGLHQIWMATSRADADRAFDLFVKTYEAKYPGAASCLAKDRDVLLSFYDFPAQHWQHIRTTNPIESVFATVRLRTKRTKGCGTRIACLTMVFKLMECASRNWRALNGSPLIADVLEGVSFVDGIKQRAA